MQCLQLPKSGSGAHHDDWRVELGNHFWTSVYVRTSTCTHASPGKRLEHSVQQIAVCQSRRSQSPYQVFA